MKFSRQRQMIYDTVMAERDHPTADAVYARLKPLNPNLSLATVYRNLNQLADAGTLRRIDGICGGTRFDGTLSPHGHFICTCCGAVEDVLTDCESDLLRTFEKDHSGMRVQSIEVIVRGLCARCAAKEPLQ